jgi:hypothetical protein
MSMRAVPMTRVSASASLVEIALETVTGSVTRSHVVKLARTEEVRPIVARTLTLHRVARERPGRIDAFVQIVTGASNMYWLIARLFRVLAGVTPASRFLDERPIS